MKQGFVKLDAIEITVLDEADHMADLGFLPGVTRIMKATPNDGQRLLFSATLDNGVDKLVKQFLHNEVLHSVDEANSPVAAMTHHVFETESVETKKALIEKLASGTGRRILFMRTKHHAKKLAKQLTDAGIPSVDLHGNLSQPQRDRNLAAFQDGTARVLVATDVAARGVHVDDIELVIHVDPPTEHKAYLHRSGRTARAGAEGDVVTLVIPSQQRDVAQLMKKADIRADHHRRDAATPPRSPRSSARSPPTSSPLRVGLPCSSRVAADARRAPTPSASVPRVTTPRVRPSPARTARVAPSRPAATAADAPEARVAAPTPVAPVPVRVRVAPAARVTAGARVRATAVRVATRPLVAARRRSTRPSPAVAP